MQDGSFHILVVDDEPSVLITYRMILEQQGYRVTAVLTSREALAAIEAGPVDLLLCDLSLEERHSGFDVIEAAQRGGVPSVLLTGYATSDSIDRAERSGIGVLFKPIDIQEFLNTISSMLRSRDEQAKTTGS